MLKPKISYTHALKKEISVNRDDPCEVVHELVSNSYDAEAREIYIWPIPISRSLVFFDIGKGISSKDKTNGITP